MWRSAHKHEFHGQPEITPKNRAARHRIDGRAFLRVIHRVVQFFWGSIVIDSSAHSDAATADMSSVVLDADCPIIPKGDHVKVFDVGHLEVRKAD